MHRSKRKDKIVKKKQQKRSVDKLASQTANISELDQVDEDPAKSSVLDDGSLAILSDSDYALADKSPSITNKRGINTKTTGKASRNSQIEPLRDAKQEVFTRVGADQVTDRKSRRVQFSKMLANDSEF